MSLGGKLDDAGHSNINEFSLSRDTPKTATVPHEMNDAYHNDLSPANTFMPFLYNKAAGDFSTFSDRALDFYEGQPLYYNHQHFTQHVEPVKMFKPVLIYQRPDTQIPTTDQDEAQRRTDNPCCKSSLGHSSFDQLQSSPYCSSDIYNGGSPTICSHNKTQLTDSNNCDEHMCPRQDSDSAASSIGKTFDILENDLKKKKEPTCSQMADDSHGLSAFRRVRTSAFRRYKNGEAVSPSRQRFEQYYNVTGGQTISTVSHPSCAVCEMSFQLARLGKNNIQPISQLLGTGQHVFPLASFPKEYYFSPFQNVDSTLPVCDQHYRKTFIDDEYHHLHGRHTEKTRNEQFWNTVRPVLHYNSKEHSLPIDTMPSQETFMCGFCEMTFYNAVKMKKHLRVHSGERPFRCDCGRAFARKEELTRHQRIHSGHRPHECQVCGKAFGRKDHLNKHRNTHLMTSEKKVHACDVPGCHQRYTRSDALARHQLTSHGIKPKASKWRPQIIRQ
ncbi:zinc finger protein 394 [Aplysia californica]|uniref:Zinc finger protein 394 n=1 Tax=Aplysia californica TaxID=6500 RepID=A0ABM0JHB5_APLCA|nr:zinc finger protein 394 [Aplysia californica]